MVDPMLKCICSGDLGMTTPNWKQIGTIAVIAVVAIVGFAGLVRFLVKKGVNVPAPVRGLAGA